MDSATCNNGGTNAILKNSCRKRNHKSVEKLAAQPQKKFCLCLIDSYCRRNKTPIKKTMN